jgi:hypothetical protein
MTGGAAQRTVTDLLAARRRARFVGRRSERELFRTAVHTDDIGWSVLFIHGPGGVGKSALLDILADDAVAAGATVVRVDGRDLAADRERQPTAPAPPDKGADDRGVVGAARAAAAPRVVLLVDTYDVLDPADDRIRRLVASVPATSLTVIAGRTPPPASWRSDPAWRDLVRVVSLRNLPPDDSRLLLRTTDVDPALHERLLAVSHGHPLALTLLADVIAHGGAPADDPLTPDLVATLVRQFIDVVPSDVHRLALEASALARVTTEFLLRDALEIADAHAVFTWLRGLSFMESGADGVAPHDLARDVLDRDLRWRDPQTYNDVFHRVRGHIHRRLRSARGAEQRQALFDEKFVFRNLRSILSPVDWDAWGRHHPQPARPDDAAAVVALVRTAEGDASAEIAARWFDRQPRAFHVTRGDDGAVTGVLALLDLTAAAAADVAADPGASAAWQHAHDQAPPRPGEQITQTRFVIDAEAYQGPSPTLNATPILTMQRYLQTPHLAWDFLTLFEPEAWDDYFALVGLPRAQDADFTIGGRRYGLFCHDFRRVPVNAWLEAMTERALTQDPTPPEVHEAQPLVLSHEEFTGAVRRALRDLQRPDLLARNPLVRTRLVRDHAGDDADASALSALVHAAIDSLRAHPRDDKLLRAVTQTYVRPSATQEAAASMLGLPFSTYRRHLTGGFDRVVAWLWDREVYGPHAGGELRA